MNGAPTEAASSLPPGSRRASRRILREAALGELGTDLNTAADETLIATGLDAGDVEIAVSVVDSADARAARSPGTPGREAEDMPVDREAPPSPDDDRNLTLSEAGEGPADDLDAGPTEEDHMDDEDTRIMEPIPAEDEIRITATNWLDEVSVEREHARLARRSRATSDTASGSTPRASATSSRCPRTRTGRSASSSTTTTAATPASRPSPAASAIRSSLLANR